MRPPVLGNCELNSEDNGECGEDEISRRAERWLGRARHFHSKHAIGQWIFAYLQRTVPACPASDLAYYSHLPTFSPGRLPLLRTPETMVRLTTEPAPQMH